MAERLDRREIVASVAVGSARSSACSPGSPGSTGRSIPLVAGIAVATCVRCLPVTHRASRPEPAVMGWVVADTAITGVIYPLLNAMILAFLGSADAVLFTSIATVSGPARDPAELHAPAPAQGALAARHRGVRGIRGGRGGRAASCSSAVGAFGFIFGAAWTESATLVPLLLACAWRAASLATTIPFAALRRAGEVRLLTGLRAVGLVLTFGLAAVGLALDSLPAVFLGLLVAELASAVVYEVARRRRLAHADARGGRDRGRR